MRVFRRARVVVVLLAVLVLVPYVREGVEAVQGWGEGLSAANNPGDRGRCQPRAGLTVVRLSRSRFPETTAHIAAARADGTAPPEDDRSSEAISRSGADLRSWYKFARFRAWRAPEKM